jgi:SnoaL-like domain
MSREEKVALVEAYLKGLAGKDLSKVPFAVDVTFEGPLVPPLAGREAVVGFLTMILPAIKDVRIGQHLVEGDYVATTFDMTTSGGIDRVFDRICIADGQIRSIRSFYYPQPLQS